MKDPNAEKRLELERRRRSLSERQKEFEARRRELDDRKKLYQERQALGKEEQELAEEEEKLIRENERLDHLELGLDYVNDAETPETEKAAETVTRRRSPKHTVGLIIAFLGIFIVIFGIVMVGAAVLFELLRGDIGEGLWGIFSGLFVILIGVIVLAIGGSVMPDTNEDSAEIRQSPHEWIVPA